MVPVTVTSFENRVFSDSSQLIIMELRWIHIGLVCLLNLITGGDVGCIATEAFWTNAHE
jgi:hypothetical protein